ncbi:hypothetical protein GE09DRAFT_449972 [Coniochaeta sp. 2T2.1]|nr:hypothetical protein GE09DRAFT_449972 [Coniochaeta sp. 2T2.1]
MVHQLFSKKTSAHTSQQHLDSGLAESGKAGKLVGKEKLIHAKGTIRIPISSLHQHHHSLDILPYKSGSSMATWQVSHKLSPSPSLTTDFRVTAPPPPTTNHQPPNPGMAFVTVTTGVQREILHSSPYAQHNPFISIGFPNMMPRNGSGGTGTKYLPHLPFFYQILTGERAARERRKRKERMPSLLTIDTHYDAVLTPASLCDTFAVQMLGAFVKGTTQFGSRS